MISCTLRYVIQVVNQGSAAPVDYEEVEEGIHPTATYSSFSKRIYSSPWGIEETRRFYEVHTRLPLSIPIVPQFTYFV